MARGDGQAKDDASFALPPFLPMISIGIQAPKAKGYALPLKNWPADPKIANKLNQQLSILKTTVMKKLIFPAVAALTLGLASCSSDEVNPGNGGGTVNYAEGGYVRLSINMPSVKGTRATSNSENDHFEDGLASEYSVKNAQLILFEGTSEDGATFHSAYDLDANMAMDASTTQITSTTKIVKKTSNNGAGSGKHLYALVVLNNNGITKVYDDATTPVPVTNGLKVNNVAFTGTFKEFSEKLAKTSAVTGKLLEQPSFVQDGFFMTNAPLADKPGNTVKPTGTIHTLTDVTKSVYTTKNEAQNAPAADIYVERGVAKVTFSEGTTGNLSGEEFQKGGNKLSYKIIGWNLDVTNKESYLVRNVRGLNSTTWSLASDNVNWTATPAPQGNRYRFVGSDPLTAVALVNSATGGTTMGSATYYRTYWGKDPNYQSSDPDYLTGTDRKFNDLSETPKLSNEFGLAHPQYCFENTFDVENQNQSQTTRVVVAVQLYLNPSTTGTPTAANLYAFNDDRSKVYSESDMQKRVKAAILNNANDDIMKNYTGTDKITADDVTTLTFTTRDDAKGTIAVKSFEIKKGTYTYTSDAARVDAVNEEIGTIVEYHNGVAYYPIRIKHFGNMSTPWEAGKNGVTAGDIYPGYNEGKYLGRYGVLRNNWYDLSVSGITGLGSATVPEVPGKNPGTTDTPDDEFYNYISVRINILSWARRTQVEEL